MSERTFEELLSDQLDGGLDEHEQKAFAELLRDPARARLYVEACQMHAMLAWEYGTMPTVEPAAPARRRWRRRVLWLLGPALAAAVVVGLVWLTQPPPIGPKPVDWAERSTAGLVGRERGGRLRVPDLDLQLAEGDELRVGDYQLDAGIVQLDMDGVELTVESPSRFRVVSNEQIRLEAGSLTAQVPKNKNRFQVEAVGTATAHFRSGAVAGIQADADASEVHVFEGDVQVQPAAAETPVLLTRSKATRVGRTGPPVGVDLDADRFTRGLDESDEDYAPLVRSFDPVVYIRMNSLPDGVTLADDARGREGDSGRVFAGRLRRPPFGNGMVGLALRLQGPEKGAYAVFPRCPTATVGLSVCAWVNAQTRTRWASVATQGTSGRGQFRLGLHADDGDLEGQVRAADGTPVTVREQSPLPLGSWQMVALVCDGSTLTLYRNASKVGSVECAGLGSDGTTPLGVGVKLGADERPTADNPGFWDGRIDELAVFHRPLSGRDIQLLHQTGMAHRKSHEPGRR